MLGMTEKAKDVMSAVEAGNRWYVQAYVSTALELGNKEGALDYLEAAFADDPRRLMYVFCTDGLSSLLGTPRFDQLLRKAGFNASLL